MNNNIEKTIGSGLSKIENGLEKGKNKVGSMKDISKLNKNIEELNLKKSQVLQEIGLIVYKHISQGNLSELEIDEKCNSVAGFEHLIYENKKRIESIKKANQGMVCTCGSTLYPNDKFCGTCGSKVEEKEEIESFILCVRCETEINTDAKFCPCCGLKVDKTC